MRPAFTVIELLVAIVVLTVGVLALAATAGLVAAHVGGGGQLTAAAHAARSVIDSLSARPCTMLASGAATSAAGDVRWIVERDSVAAWIDVRVGTALRRRSVLNAYQAVVPCTAE